MRLRHLLLGMMTAAGLAACAHAEVPVAVTTSMRNEAARSNAFGLDLYQQLRTREGNIAFSPVSVRLALLIAREGTQGNTAEEMIKALHSTDRPLTRKTYGSIVDRVAAQPTKAGYQLSIANRVWIAPDFKIRKEYAAALEGYRASVEALDFGKGGAAAGAINSWVAKQTRDRITKLVEPSSFDRLTRMFITNATYFKGRWAVPFDSKQTYDDDFTIAPGQTVKAKFMRARKSLPYAKLRIAERNVETVALPYVGELLSMVILLPAAGELPAVEKALDADALKQVLATKPDADRVNVLLPRFTLEYEASLKPALEALGIKEAFDGSRADFGLATTERNLFISQVLHKACIKVNEEGTEAAAVTGAGIATTSIPAQLKINHPFLLLLRDNATGAVLFLGRVVNPQ